MKHIKKVITLLLAAVMVLAMSSVAFAAGETTATTEKGSIEITSPKTDPNADKTTYEAYKIFDMTTNGDKTDGKYTAVAYTINSDWTSFFATGAPGAAYLVDENNAEKTLNQITVNGAKKYLNITDSNVATFAKAAFEFAQKNNINPKTTQEVNKGATTVKFENLDLGYYMIYPKGASVQSGSYTSIVSITSTEPNATVAQKAEYPKMTKTADDISTEVGQTVTYTLNSNVPDTTGYTAYEFTFKDKTSAGLTYDGNDKVEVTIGGTKLTADTDYTFAASPSDGNDFELTINLLKNDKTAKYTYNAPIVITYTATVNSNAVSKIDNNHATLTYNNDPKDGSKKDTTPPVEVKTYSSKVVIDKVDGKNKTTKLEHAKFVLRVKTLGTATGDSHETDIAVGKYYKKASDGAVSWVAVSGNPTAEQLAANTDITVVETDANGAANFEGLEDGTYELIEVAAPDGYNLLTEPVEVTIAGSDSDETKLTVTSAVENNSGSQLPATGGIGTVIFYVLGSALLIGCAIVLISRRRTQKNN